MTKKPNREGALIFGFTPKQLDAQNVLLEPGIRTYEDGAKRLGISLSAFKQRMSRSKAQVVRASQVVNEWRRFKDARKKHLKGERQ